LAAGISHRPRVVVVNFAVRNHQAGHSRRPHVGSNEHDRVGMIAVPRGRG
jgi:hypothetical protein